MGRREAEGSLSCRGPHICRGLYICRGPHICRGEANVIGQMWEGCLPSGAMADGGGLLPGYTSRSWPCCNCRLCLYPWILLTTEGCEDAWGLGRHMWSHWCLRSVPQRGLSRSEWPGLPPGAPERSWPVLQPGAMSGFRVPTAPRVCADVHGS